MKLITRETDYAVRALCFMARNKRKVISVSELVANLRVPRPFLRKILQILNKKAMLRSQRGLGGGFELALAPKKIYLLDLMKIFQGPLRLNECLLKKATCPNVRSCKLKKRIDRIQRFIISELKDITLAYLLKQKD